MELFWPLALASSPGDGLPRPALGDREHPVRGLEAKGDLVRGKTRKAPWEDASNFLLFQPPPLLSSPQRSALMLPPSLCAQRRSEPADLLLRIVPASVRPASEPWLFWWIEAPRKVVTNTQHRSTRRGTEDRGQPVSQPVFRGTRTLMLSLPADSL